MRFNDIDQALSLGCNVRGFRSEDGIVTVVIEKTGVMITAFGGLLSGTMAAHPLYRWLAKGNTFDCRLVGNDVVFTAKGKSAIRPPEDVKARALESGQAVIWEHDGFRYKTTWSKIVNGSRAGTADFATSLVNVPDAVVKYDLLGDLLQEEVVYEARAGSAQEAISSVISQIS